MGRFKDIDTEIRSMSFDGFDANDIADFLNVDVTDVDDILDLDVSDLRGYAEDTNNMDSDFYGSN
jgi:hypothetical protein